MNPFLITVLTQMLVGLAIEVVGYLLMPKAKTDKEATKDMENPTAEAGRPIPVVFGEVEIKGVNILWFGDKDQHTHDL